MQHQRDAHGFPAPAGEFRAVRGGRGGHGLALDVGEIDAAALEQLAVFDQARYAAATLWPVPGVTQEGCAFDGFEFADDAILQAGEIGADRRDVHQSSGSFMASTFSLWRARNSSSFFASSRP